MIHKPKKNKKYPAVHVAVVYNVHQSDTCFPETRVQVGLVTLVRQVTSKKWHATISQNDKKEIISAKILKFSLKI